MKRTYQEEGLRAFWKGCLPRMIGVSPSTAISWSAYELLKTFLTQQSNKH